MKKKWKKLKKIVSSRIHICIARALGFDPTNELMALEQVTTCLP